jgi:hypothetical protein
MIRLRPNGCGHFLNRHSGVFAQQLGHETDAIQGLMGDDHKRHPAVRRQVLKELL